MQGKVIIWNFYTSHSSSNPPQSDLHDGHTIYNVCPYTVETSKGFWMKLSDSFSTSQAKRSCQACPWNWSLTTIRLITLVPPTLYWMDGVMNPWNYYAACFFSFMTHDWSWSDEDDEERYGSFVKTLVADNNDVMSVGKFSATYGSELESSFRFWAYKPQGL